MLDLRPATMADGDILFAWTNDPVTRAQSKSTAAIQREDHDRWMQFNVAQGYPQHLVMMADGEHGSIGVVRFDAERGDVMSYTASITIAPRCRGQGLSFGILSEALRYMQEFTINAEIRRGNAASHRVFERCGFTEIGTSADFVKYRKEAMS